MLEPFFFALGLVNSVVLIFIFLVRKNHLALLQRIGWVYFLLAIPAIYAIFLVQQEQKTPRYTVFLGIFLAFLAIEALYDWILKIPFREKMDWKQLVPYVALYISMQLWICGNDLEILFLDRRDHLAWSLCHPNHCKHSHASRVHNRKKVTSGLCTGAP